MARSRFPLPEVIDPPDRICVKLYIPDDTWHKAAFLGAVYKLTRWFAWDEDEDKTGKLVADVWQPIYDELEQIIGHQNCVEEGFPMLRTNPEDNCQMQYQDQYGEWITFFDFGLCGAFSQGSEIIEYTETNNYINTANNELNVYLSDPDNYPTQEEINALAVADRDKLLCYALRVLITTMLEVVAKDTDRAEKGTVTLAIVVGAVIALGFTPFSPVVTGLMLAGFTFGGLIGVASVGGSEYRDPVGQDKVLCYIYESLMGDNLTMSNFANSLNGNTFASGTPEYAQANALSQLFAKQQVYLSVINWMKDNLAFVDALVNECEGCGGWTIVFDFTTGSYSFTERVATTSERINGQGWRSIQNTILATFRSAGCKRVLNLGSSVMTGVRVEWYSTNAKTLNWQIQLPSQVVELPSGTGEQTYSITTSKTGNVQLDVVLNYAKSLAITSHYIRKITISGTGTTPSL